MADTITDNRTLVDNLDTTASTVDLSGGGAGTADAEILIQGAASVGQYLTSSLSGLLFDAGAAQDWSNNVFYIWINCGIVGLLDTQANGGFRIRFTGATVTNWFEVYVAGSDNWPSAIQGGWTQFVVDIETARSTAITNGWTNGTVPATTAIQRVGWAGITGGTMPRMVDNTWMDEIRRLPDGTAGILVQGQNGGVTPWTWSDLPTQLGTATGTAKIGSGGAVVLNTSVQFFVDDATDHHFQDANNTLVLFEDQEFAPSDLYGFTVVGAVTGTANFQLGTVTGIGDDQVGSLGGAIQAASTGVRFFFDGNSANLDSCNLYGVSFSHGSDFQLDNNTTSVVSCTFIDCTNAVVSNAEDFLRCSVIDANTLDGVAFITTDDLTDIVFCDFSFSDGHAIELITPIVSTQTSKGNIFSGYDVIGTNDAAVYNNTGGAVTINVTNDGSNITYRNGPGASTTVNISVGLEINGLTEGSRAVIIGNGGAEDGNILLGGYADNTGAVAGTFGGTTPQDVIIRARNGGIINAAIQDDGGVFTDFTTEARSLTTSPGTGVTDDVDLFPTTPAANDAFYFAGLAKFGQVVINITTAGSGYSGTWEYWNGTWASLTVTDGTSSFQTSGNGLLVSFTIPTDWATTTINSQGPFFYIRFRVTSVTAPTQAQADSISLNKTTKYQPFTSTGTIQSSGLTATVVWLVDTNNLN